MVEGIAFMVYLFMIISSEVAKKVLIGLGVFFLLFSIVDMTRSKAESFDSIPTAVECLILIGFSIYFFYEQLKNPDSLFLYNTPNFWIVVGIILFFSGSFFVFIYAQNNSKSPEFSYTFRMINMICGLIENILFLIAFLIAKNESKSIKPNIIPKT
jgi:hypothetical protein